MNCTTSQAGARKRHLHAVPARVRWLSVTFKTTEPTRSVTSCVDHWLACKCSHRQRYITVQTTTTASLAHLYSRGIPRYLCVGWGSYWLLRSKVGKFSHVENLCFDYFILGLVSNSGMLALWRACLHTGIIDGGSFKAIMHLVSQCGYISLPSSEDNVDMSSLTELEHIFLLCRAGWCKHGLTSTYWHALMILRKEYSQTYAVGKCAQSHENTINTKARAEFVPISHLKLPQHIAIGVTAASTNITAESSQNKPL